MIDDEARQLGMEVHALTVVLLGLGAVVAYVVVAVSLSLFFRKVGVERWIAWVPYYNVWKWLEVGGQRGEWALLMLVPGGGIVTAIFLIIGMHRTGIAFGKGAATVVLGAFLPVVWLLFYAFQAGIYRPELITAAGYPPPLAGYIAVRQTYRPAPAPR